jgi:hypothetical protein
VNSLLYDELNQKKGCNKFKVVDENPSQVNGVRVRSKGSFHSLLTGTSSLAPRTIDGR